MKNTKGEWYVEEPNPYAKIEDGVHPTFHYTVHTRHEQDAWGCIGHQVCEISSLNSGTEESDARLISAAKEMIEALQAFVDVYGVDDVKRWMKVRDNAIAAIAKALGE